MYRAEADIQLSHTLTRSETTLMGVPAGSGVVFPTVNREPQSGRVQSLIHPRPVPVKQVLRWGGVLSSYRLISTGQLHESLVLASTSRLSTQ